MPNQEITSALRNAVERGESLKLAKQTLVSAGYNTKEVEEASHFVYSGIMPNLETAKQPLNFFKQQGFFSKIFSKFKRKQKPKQSTPPVQTIPRPLPSTTQAPPKKSNIKIIILAIVLVLLLGILGATIFFKDQILSLLGV